MPAVATLSVTTDAERPRISRHFVISAMMDGELARCLVDNACTSNYAHERWAKKNPRVRRSKLPKPVATLGFNDSVGGQVSQVAHIADVDVNGHHESSLNAWVTDIGQYDFILGLPWLEQHGLTYSIADRTLTFSDGVSARCETLRAASPAPRLRRTDGETSPSDDTPTPQVNMVGIGEACDDPDFLDGYLVWETTHEDKATALHDVGLHISALNQADIDKYMKGKPVIGDELAEELLPEELKDLAYCFSQQSATNLPPHREGVDLAIDFEPGAPMPFKRPYPMGGRELEVIKKHIDDEQGKGKIRPSKSRIASPVMIAHKPGGGLRICVDYRAVNAITIKNRYPIPQIRETLASFGRAKMFTVLDIIAAFNMLRIKEGDEWKTAFTTRYGTYEYLVVPFGLCNAPAAFQGYINKALFDFLDDGASAYLDDVVVYAGEERKEHAAYVRRVIQRLHEHGLPIDILKCKFFVKEVKYLGIIIVAGVGIKMDPEKVQAIQEWAIPQNVKDVLAFLGLCNFYRRFIEAFGSIAFPLTAITKGSNKPKSERPKFEWTTDCQAAFDALKHAFMTAPVLRHYDPDLPCTVEADSSDTVTGGQLCQPDENGVLHPIAFYSKKMIPAECNYEIYDKELMAIVRAFEEWRPELMGTADPVKVVTDHKGLETFMSTKQLNRRQARWAEFLAGFDFTISYRPGSQNGVADALSRRSQDIDSNRAADVDFRQQAILKPHNLSPEVQSHLVRAKLVQDHHEVPSVACLSLPDAASTAHRQHALALAVLEIIDEAETIAPVTLRSAARPAPPTAGPEGGGVWLQPTVEEVQDEGEPEEQQEQRLDNVAFDNELRAAYADDEVATGILHALQNQENRIATRLDTRISIDECSLDDLGNIRVRNRLYVPDSEVLRARVMREHHNLPLAGHPGREKMYALLCRDFFWPGMAADVRRYCKACHTCSRNKSWHDAYQGGLRQLRLPKGAYTEVTIDHVVELPASKSLDDGVTYTNALTLTCRLTKRKHYMPVKDLSATTAADAILRYVIKDQGLFNVCYSDRGTQWTGDFWKRLSQRLGIEQRLSTAFHPQTDGQSENTNKGMEQYLRAYVNYVQDDWVNWLPMAEFAANNSGSDALGGVTPFFATLGRNPRMHVLPAAQALAVGPARALQLSADEFAHQMEELHQHCREQLQFTQGRYDEAVTRRRPAVRHAVGDQVWLDTRNILTRRPCKKLDHKNSGPFTILTVIAPDVYRLDLPTSMEIHPVFHANLLRPAASQPFPNQQDTEPAPQIDDQGRLGYEVEEVVGSRWTGTRHRDIKYTVRWVGGAITSEKYSAMGNSAEDLIADFHHFNPAADGPMEGWTPAEDWTPPPPRIGEAAEPHQRRRRTRTRTAAAVGAASH
jgi:hypothetical protein